MFKYSIDNITPGMRFNKPLYLDKDTLFLKELVSISENDIDTLKKFGIEDVFSLGTPIPADQPIEVPTETFVKDVLPPLEDKDDDSQRLKSVHDEIIKLKYSFPELYKRSYETMSSIYKSFQENKEFDYQNVLQLSNDIFEATKSNPHISYFLLNSPYKGSYVINQACIASFYTGIIASALDLNRPKILEILQGAILADIGMASIPENILDKTTSLTDLEIKLIMRHTIMGYQYLNQKLKIKNAVSMISLQHHERNDGSWYPQKKTGADLDDSVKIFSIADSYASMISPRPYRKQTIPYEALRLMIGQRLNRYDMKFVRAFLNQVSMFPVGSVVELSDGRTAVVIEANKDKPLRPSLRILKEPNGSITNRLKFVNLSHPSFVQLSISKAIDNNGFILY